MQTDKETYTERQRDICRQINRKERRLKTGRTRSDTEKPRLLPTKVAYRVDLQGYKDLIVPTMGGGGVRNIENLPRYDNHTPAKAFRRTGGLAI